MATEVAVFKLKAGKHPDDANSATGQVLKDTLDTLIEQKGFQRAYWGLEHENQDSFRLFVDWEDVNAHTAFTKTDTYKSFLDRFGQIADINSAQIFHVHFKPHPAQQALSDSVSPTTEIGTIYFSPEIPESEQQKFAETFKQQCQKIVDSSDKATGAAAGGWAVEEVAIPGTSEKGKVYVGAIGWQSVEDHILWRNTPSHDENVKLFNQYVEYVKHTDIKHFSGTQVTSGGGGVADVPGPNVPDVQGEVLNPQVGGEKIAPKTRADGTTTKNNDTLKGAANSLHKARVGR